MIALIVILALLGLLYWAVTTLIPMPTQIQRVILVVVVVIAVLLVLQAFGLLPAGVPHLRP